MAITLPMGRKYRVRASKRVNTIARANVGAELVIRHGTISGIVIMDKKRRNNSRKVMMLP